MTVQDVADLLACSIRKVYDLPLKSARIAGKRLYLFSDVMEYVERERDAL